ncbi:MAG TPA: GAF domain-containing protein, partial [Anaerolineaceae bacterium]
SALVSQDWQTNLVLAEGIVGAGAAALLTEYTPFAQMTISEMPVLTPLIIGVLFVISIIILARQYVTTTLRVRLVITFLLIVIIPLTILSIIQSQFMFSVLTNQVSQALELASQQTANGVDQFISDHQRSVVEASKFDIFRKYLARGETQREGSPEEQEMRLTLRLLDSNELNHNIYISSYALLDEHGIAVYDTLRDQVAMRFSSDSLRAMGIDVDSLRNAQGADESGKAYFQAPMKTGTPYITQFEMATSTNAFFYVSAPIKDATGKVLGVLRVRYDGAMLQDLLKASSGLLGKYSYAILVDEYNIRLADVYTPNDLFKSMAPLPDSKIKALIASKRLPNRPPELLSTNHPEMAKILYSFNMKSNPLFISNISPGLTAMQQIGAISGLRTMPWKLIYVRADYSDEALRSDQRRLSTLVTILIAGIVGFLAIGMTQLLSSPINHLTRTALLVSSGDLEAQAPVRSEDEFGMLGAAFNSMTFQLRTLIAQLEDRVKARTKEIEEQNLTLANRARQLQTVADVARQIVSMQDLEPLLVQVTRLVSERFGFYHVGIFLLDDKGEYAVLRAANSEGGNRMQARQHKLQVGKVGIVGYATGVGEARIATDVGDDAVYFNNPDLPETRSEMALPLKVGGQVIGALDIQSKVSNDFHGNDIELFSTLADQVAIAIYNNRLYSETRQALDEAQKLHRQYLRSEWAADASHRKTLGYLFNQAGTTPQQAENPLWKKVFASGDAVYATLPGDNGTAHKAVMAVPISVRGETIGVIHIQDQGDERMWSEDEVSMVNGIASQVAIALENARLFENTVRRAEREKKVLQITGKIRSTNDPEEMMRIAVRELQAALQATRTQIYIRQDETGSDDGTSEGAK